MLHMALFALQDGGAAPEGFGGGMLVNYLVLIGILFAVFYFLLIRPERKRRTQMQDMISALKPGDKVITIGGIHGTVVGVTDKSIVLRIAEQVKIEVTRQAVGTVVTPEGEVTTEEKK